MEHLNGTHYFEFGEFQLDAGRKVLRRNGEMVSLPLKSLELLSVLAQNQGEVVTKDELMTRVWQDSFVEDSVLTQNIYILRKTLKANGEPATITNIPRRGYMFETAAVPDASDKEIPTVEVKGAPVTAGGLRRDGRIFAAIAFLGIFVTGFAIYSYLKAEKSAAPVSAASLKLKPVSQPSTMQRVAVVKFTSNDETVGSMFANDLSIRIGSVNKFMVIPASRLAEAEGLGEEIKTDLYLTGDVSTDNGRYSANVRLIDVAGDAELWSDRFEFDNAIQLLDAISNATSKAIVERMSDSERELTAKRLPTNFTAYQYYINGSELWRSRKSGAVLLRKAVELDQNLAAAYVFLAADAAMGSNVTEAENLLKKAFAIDDNLADAYAVQGFISIFHRRDWDSAEKSLRNAIQLDGNNVNARHWLAVFHSIRRNLPVAIAELHIALELDPTNPTLLADMGQLHYFAGNRSKAEEFIARAIKIDGAHSMATAYQKEYFGEPVATNPSELLALAESQAASVAFTLPYLNIDPRFDPVRTDPRFIKIIQQMGL